VKRHGLFPVKRRTRHAPARQVSAADLDACGRGGARIGHVEGAVVERKVLIIGWRRGWSRDVSSLKSRIDDIACQCVVLV
jgi:hypothetical protein